MVKITEATVARDKALHGLAISVSLLEGETVESDFYAIKDALVAWQQAHGSLASSVLIEYRTPDSSRQEIEAFWLAKFESDHLIRKLFATVDDVVLCLMTLDGRDVRQIGFEGIRR
jgi:hypothetical protein